MRMNQEQAEALCAIIALGFVGQNERADDNNRVLYIYDSDRDGDQHGELANRLRAHYGIQIASNLQNAKDALTNKKIHPFIYALPYGNVNEPRKLSYEEVKANEREVLDIVQRAEDCIDTKITPTNRFRGAYIGGFLNYREGRLSLIGPSGLYLRRREYLAADSPAPEAVGEMYIEFANTTRELKHFLKTDAALLNTGGDGYENITTAPDLTEELITEAQEGDDQRIVDGDMIFGSCHGLITSMYYHSDVSPKHLEDGVCVELSLSRDTCKAASCIPCAIFAAAQGAPASAVHFGRGDFWNLPAIGIRSALNARLEENWRGFVKACFAAGSEAVQNCGQPLPPVTRQMASLVGNENELVVIPEMFLDALTFEGAFIGKMLTYL